MIKNRFARQWPRIFIAYTVCILFYNEFLVYSISQLLWKHISCTNASCNRILFVADPQILGETLDTNFYQGLAIFDSDRYLKKTFNQAIGHVRPNIICYMGDLMDEGSVASASEYIRYLDRFRQIYKTQELVELMHIPGDNDIGGERQDYVTEFKTNRFKQAFGDRSFLETNNMYRLVNVNLLTHKYPDLNDGDGSDIGPLSNIILTHISMLSYPGQFTDTITNKFKPEVIFSAHSHISRVITLPPVHFEYLNDNSILKITLRTNEMIDGKRKITEIMVPTCSYRMGVKNIGFGMAVLDGNVLHYTVLWLPDRFFCLYWYIIWLIVSVITIIAWIKSKWSTICRILSHHRRYRIGEF